MRKILSIWIGKSSLFFTRLFGTGSGTTLPGLLAEIVDPNIIKKLSLYLKNGVIIVTGTNGKTTVSKMITEILTEEGYRVLNNASGSNLTRGIASALISSVNVFGLGHRSDIAVLEVDEATMPEVTAKIKPKVVLVTNLFRDQLDRYGELDKTATLIGSSLRGFTDIKVILNADDPLVASLKNYIDGQVLFFGIDDPKITTSSKAAMDSKDCIKCGHELKYLTRYFGHLGYWECLNCGEKRPQLDFSAKEVALSVSETKFRFISGERTNFEIKLSLPGLYNVYNALSAAAVTEAIGAGGPAISAAMAQFSAAFGRMEELEIKDRKAMLLLVKNPTGANQALAAILSDMRPKKILFALNDNFADGTDVSWIWDIDFEAFELSGNMFVASGIRAEDIALRFKYAGVDPESIFLEKDPIRAMEKMAELTRAGETFYVFPTYTAMIDIRNHFSEKNDKHSDLGKVTKKGL